MKKKLMLFVALPVVGLVSFGGAFAVALLTGAPPAPDPNDSQTPPVSMAQQNALGSSVPARPVSAFEQEKQKQRAMSENKLRELIQDVEAQIAKYNQRLTGLDERERQLAQVQVALKEDIDHLDKMRVDVAAAVANLKIQRDELMKTRIEISNEEQVNMKLQADMLSALEEKNASTMLANMCDSKQTGSSDDREVRINNAAKILYLINDKKRGPILDALIKADDKLAALLYLKIKQISIKQ